MSMKFRLEEILPKIYLLIADDATELAQLFMRCQEFYENPTWKGKNFTIQEFTDWYIEEYGEMSYSTDWVGFNIPVQEIRNCYKNCPDWNKWDDIMTDWVFFRNLPVDGYLIGVSTKHISAIDHEIAHGLYTTNQEYRDEMIKLTASSDQELINKVRADITLQMYHPSVVDDELQAYLATGISVNIIPTVVPEELQSNYKSIFTKFSKDKK